MARNTGRLTDGLATALMTFGEVPMEFHPGLNLTGVLGRRKRQYRMLKKRGLLKRVTAYQSGYIAYYITPKGLGALDHWATTGS